MAGAPQLAREGCQRRPCILLAENLPDWVEQRAYGLLVEGNHVGQDAGMGLRVRQVESAAEDMAELVM